MPALCVQIADAVVALVGGSTLNQPFLIERQWVETQPRENIRESDPARVIVIPRTLAVTAFDLAPRNAFSWDIGVWIDKAVQNTPVGCDPMAEFLEQVVTVLATHRSLGISAGLATLIGITPDPSYDSVQLLNVRVFRSVFLASYRIVR